MAEDPVEFDPFSSTYFEDPSEVYRRLRDEAPVYCNERYGFYALSRFDDVVAAHRDWRAFSSTHGVSLEMLQGDPAEIDKFRSLIMMDPPGHDRMRGLVSRAFTPRAIAALEPMVREVVAGYLDTLPDPTRFDLVKDVSGPFPVEIICRMLGVPAGDSQQVREWLDLGLHRDEGRMETTDRGREAMVEIGIYFYGLTAEKRANPVDDMFSRLTQVTVERADGSETGLDDVEVAGFAALLGGAGAETVTKLVGNAGVLFGRHQDAWDAITEDQDRIPAAVEEILRILPPSQYQGRFSKEERTFEGGTIPAGYPVLLLTGAATRDERHFDDPDAFRIDRPPTMAIGFGHGIHSCLGAALARLESRIAIEELVRRYRRIEVDEAGLRRVQMSNVAGYAAVPVAGQLR